MDLSQNVKVTWKGKTLSAAATVAGKRQIHAEAEGILTRTIPRTPIDKGPLRASGHVTDVTNGSEISFSTPYAVRQHEDTSLHHTDGESKFLEKEFAESSKDAIKNIGAAIGVTLR